VTRPSTESTSDDDNEEVKEDALGRVVVVNVVDDAGERLNERGEDGGATILIEEGGKTLQELSRGRSVGIIVETRKFTVRSKRRWKS